MQRLFALVVAALALVASAAPVGAIGTTPAQEGGEGARSGPTADELLVEDLAYTLIDEVWSTARLGLLDPDGLGDLAPVVDLVLFGDESPPAADLLASSEDLAEDQLAELDDAGVEVDAAIRRALGRQAGAVRDAALFAEALTLAFGHAELTMETLIDTYGRAERSAAPAASAASPEPATSGAATTGAAPSAGLASGAAPAAPRNPVAPSDPSDPAGPSTAPNDDGRASPQPPPRGPADAASDDAAPWLLLIVGAMAGIGLAFGWRRLAAREVREPIDLATLGTTATPERQSAREIGDRAHGSGAVELPWSMAPQRDEVTRTWNRRRLRRDLLDVGERGRTVSMVKVAVDDLDRITHDFGVEARDAVLCSVADTLRSVVRDTDVVYRYGRDEFCLLLADTPSDVAERVSDRVRWRVSAGRVRHEGTRLPPVTVSAGVASRDDGHMSALVASVDDALHDARRQRDTVLTAR